MAVPGDPDEMESHDAAMEVSKSQSSVAPPEGVRMVLVLLRLQAQQHSARQRTSCLT